jgi:hypothetical protein
MSGTDFPDSVKLEARRLAYFRCCYCHDRPGDDVHHLTPKEEGGLGNIDNDHFSVRAVPRGLRTSARKTGATTTSAGPLV